MQALQALSASLLQQQIMAQVTQRVSQMESQEKRLTRAPRTGSHLPDLVPVNMAVSKDAVTGRRQVRWTDLGAGVCFRPRLPAQWTFQACLLAKESAPDMHPVTLSARAVVVGQVTWEGVGSWMLDQSRYHIFVLDKILLEVRTLFL